MNFRYTISLIILLQSTICSASHNYGAEITYRHIVAYTYEVTIVTYTKASAQADRCELEFNWGDGTIDTLYRINGDFTVCGATIGSGEIITGTDFLLSIYIGVHTYPGYGVFVVSMLDPNRADDIRNMLDSFNTPLYVEAIMMISSSFCANNSVKFGEIPILYAQAGSRLSHNLAVIDPDGDSLSFNFTDCLQGAGITATGYSPPINISLNPLTGEFVWEIPALISTYDDRYSLAMQITEWRQGLIISKVTRDFMIVVTDQVNTSYIFDTVGTWNTNLVDSVYAGDTASFSLVYTDALAPPSDLSAYGEVFTLSTPATFSTDTMPDTIQGNFQWIPDSTYARGNPYIITFRGTSGSTPQIQNDLTISIYVIGSKEDCIPPPVSIQEFDNEPISVLVSPNPFTTSASISLTDGSRMTRFRLFDLLGKEVMKINNIKKSEFELNRGQLSNGLYLFEIIDNKEYLLTGKLVIN